MCAMDVGKSTMCRRIPRAVPSVQYRTETPRLSMKMIQANKKIANMIKGRMTHCTVVDMKSAMTVVSFRG
jgi:hypothetical protein